MLNSAMARHIVARNEKVGRIGKTKDSLVPVRQKMSTKEVEYKVNGQWKPIEGKVKTAYENEQMKYDRAEGGYHYYTCEVRDSRTKDETINYKGVDIIYSSHLGYYYVTKQSKYGNGEYSGPGFKTLNEAKSYIDTNGKTKDYRMESEYRGLKLRHKGMFLQAVNPDGFVKFEVRASNGSSGYTEQDVGNLKAKIDSMTGDAKGAYNRYTPKKKSQDGKTKDKYGDKVAYKGYLIGEYSNGKFWVEKDGTVIRHEAPTIEEAKKDIDMLTSDSKTKDLRYREWQIVEKDGSWRILGNDFPVLNNTKYGSYEDAKYAIDKYMKEYSPLDSKMKDAKNYNGERSFRTYEAWKAACKKINPNVVFEGDKDTAQAKPGIGEWDGNEGVIYTKDSKTKDDNLSGEVGNYKGFTIFINRKNNEFSASNGRDFYKGVSEQDVKNQIDKNVQGSKDASTSKEFNELKAWQNKAMELGYRLQNNTQRGLWVAYREGNEVGTFVPTRGGQLYIDSKDAYDPTKPKNMRFRIKDDKLFMLKGAARKMKDAVGGLYSNLQEWQQAAKQRGYTVRQSVHPSGSGIQYNAKTNEGNERGVFDPITNKGTLDSKAKDAYDPTKPKNIVKAKTLAKAQGVAASDKKTKDSSIPYKGYRIEAYEKGPGRSVVIIYDANALIKYRGEFFLSLQESITKAKEKIDAKNFAIDSFDANLPTYHFEGSNPDDWKKLVLQYHPNASINPERNGFVAKVGGISGEEVGSIGQVKPGLFRGGYRKGLQRDTKDSDKDFALFYKSKLDEAIDSDDKEGMKRWSQELIDHYTTDADSEVTIGKHDDVPDSEFDAEELAKGIKVEMEHTDDLEIAKSIARDHLSEIKDYYTRLLKMESEAKTKDENPTIFGRSWEQIKAAQQGNSSALNPPIKLRSGDYGADPLGNGKYKMVPSGDIVDFAERNRRLA